MESLEIMNAQQAADYLGVELYWLQTHWKSEGIPTIRYSPRGRLRFRKSSLDAWAAEREKVWVGTDGAKRKRTKSRKVQLV